MPMNISNVRSTTMRGADRRAVFVVPTQDLQRNPTGHCTRHWLHSGALQSMQVNRESWWSHFVAKVLLWTLATALSNSFCPKSN
jgi:hypothetical protein